ncbi:MAG TPA: tRNA (N(6)-L-threonylcarbamoyladenosine(37)-C(2))-methylthiotransferase MtaB [Candidatus Binatia bacterium]|nr:tRNA (N(6)-L-threonylcarbamoyladenosine(37)-C(2))-methylthiotransferase MtaB [Candidatus Binatia bacterium]
MKVAITTLGCKVNQYDTASVATELIRAGHAVEDFGPGADVYIVNSCTVTDRADAESRQLVRRAKRWNPAARVILTGCYAAANPDGAAAVAEVDYVVSLGQRAELLGAVDGTLNGRRIHVDNLRKAEGAPLLGADVFAGRTRAFLKVQDGCDLFCTFCIVPWSRGRSRSVPPRAILDELDRLAARGFQEVVLTGIHLGGYGHDLSPRIGLAELVEMIAERRPLPRVRLSSIDPPEVSARLLDLMRQSDVICPHLHMPIQSGDDTVLRRMRRRYDAALVREVATEIRRRLPEAGLGTDVIAGFPGETEEQFANTVILLETHPFTYLHAFPFSRRTGTTAAKQFGHLPKRDIAARAQRLRMLGERKRREFAARFVGAQLRVLVEAGDDGRGCVGYARNYVRVAVAGNAIAGNREVSVRVHGVRRDCAEGVVDAA